MRREVASVLQQFANDQPADVRESLELYLTQIPATIRQSMRRPADPGGTTVPRGFILRKSADLLPLLPERPPQFRSGENPLSGIDWELVELLGVGGFGEVWKARNPYVPHASPVALKFCLDPEAARSLRREAGLLDRVMRQGQHPGIVQLRHTYLSAEPPCLEYECVDGGDLGGLISEWQRRHGGPTPEEAVRVIRRLAEIVAVAHGLDPPLVHRDLKPANILIQQNDNGKHNLKIADFGIGGLAASQMIRHTQTGMSQAGFLATSLRGSHTPLYASPQQMRGEQPDPRDDVHALGVIWYQLLTGDLSAGPPTGRRWPKRLQERGMTDEQIDVLADCFESEPGARPADANILVERLNDLFSARQAKQSTAKRQAQSPDPPIHTEVDTASDDVKKPSTSAQHAPAPQQRPRKRSAQPELASVPFDEQTARQKQQEWADYLGKQVTETNSLGMQMVLIPPGEFTMGSPPNEEGRSVDEEQVEVRLTEPFWLSQYTVTQSDWQRLMKTTPWKGKSCTRQGAKIPATYVSWADAMEFCKNLTEREHNSGKLPDKWKYTLPTEAQWEYACRAGTTTRFHYGDDEEQLDEYAWFDDNANVGFVKSIFGGEKYAHEVGQKRPNPFGLFDMHGNVWEWCRDWSQEVLPGGTDPVVTDEASYRVLRGGSWNDSAGGCRSALRLRDSPVNRLFDLGFRLARVPVTN